MMSSENRMRVTVDAEKTPMPATMEKCSSRDEQRVLASEELFRGRRELRIVHADQEYRLFITSKGKLILTK